jgi:hypothetical protein
LAANALDAIVVRKKQREADLAAGKIESSGAASLAPTVVRIVPPGQEERLLALLAMVSEVTLPELKSTSLGQIAGMLATAVQAEGRGDATVSFAAPSRASLAWQDASDADRAPFFEILRSMYGGYIEAAEKGETPAPESEEAATLDPPAEYGRAAPIVTIRLQFPVIEQGRRIAAVNLWPPGYGAVQAVTKGRITRVDLVASMAGLPAAVIRALRWPDAERVVAIALDLCPDFEGV